MNQERIRTLYPTALICGYKIRKQAGTPDGVWKLTSASNETRIKPLISYFPNSFRSARTEIGKLDLKFEWNLEKQRCSYLVSFILADLNSFKLTLGTSFGLFQT